MPSLINAVSDLLALVVEHSGALLLLSLLILVLTLVLLPVIVARLPVDYFSRIRGDKSAPATRRTIGSLFLLCCRNLLGALLVILGLLMLVTPGQGLLTLFVGLMLMNYPGKRALERWLARRNGAMEGLNWLRRKSGQPLLQPPHSAGAAAIED